MNGSKGSGEAPRDEVWVGKEFLQANIRLDADDAEYEKSVQQALEECSKVPGTYRPLLRGILFLMRQDSTDARTHSRLEALGKLVAKRASLPWGVDK